MARLFAIQRQQVRLESARIEVDGQPVAVAAKIYLMLNKPRGVVTTASDEKGRQTVYGFLDAGLPWISPVGRLDKASEGLLLLTNDSEWAAQVTAPETHLDKTYHVQINKVADGREPEILRAVDGVDLGSGAARHSGWWANPAAASRRLAAASSGSTSRPRGRSLRGSAAAEQASQRRRIQMVFQDPYASLNPRMTVRQTLAELLLAHRLVPKAAVEARCRELLDLVGLGSRALDAYPRQFSGGQRQRIAIARALALEPES